MLLGVTCFAASLANADEPIAITYASHIAAVMNKHCVECHREGMAAPFALDSLEAVQRRARLIAKVVERGVMPPWKPERGHEPLVGERGLEATELQLLRDWVAQGAPEGDPALTPAPPQFPSGGWILGEPDLVVEMAETFEVPAEGPDMYQNFVVPLDMVTERKWIKAVEFRASAPSVVHHSLLDLDYHGLGRMLDKDDPGPGFSGVDQSFEDNRIAGYAVGSLPYWLPDGTAYELRPGADLIIESHFHPTGKAERERSQVAFYFTDEAPTREIVSLPMPPTFGMPLAIDIPAGESRYTVKHRYKLAYDAHAFHIFPHAHMLCREMLSVAKLPNGERKTLLSIKDWDFAWQEQYRFSEMPLLPAGTTIDLTFVYDNSEDNPSNPHHPPQRVKWGHQTTDEMASLTLTVVPARNEEAEPLREAHYEYQRKVYREAPVEFLQEVVGGELLRRFDRNRNGELGLLEYPHVLAFAAKVRRLTPGNRAYQLEEYAFNRAFGPTLKRKAERALTYASLTGISVLLLGIGAAGWFWQRRRAVRKPAASPD
jgi:hypothetical protein